jgi:hypothetical protein
MKAKSTTKRKNTNAPNAEPLDDCYLRVKAMLDFRLMVTAMRNISVSPSQDGHEPVVELCGTVNFEQTKTFAEETARLASCVKDGTHKLVNSIKVVPPIDPRSDQAMAAVDDCYLRVKAMLDSRLTVTGMQNISVSPSHDGLKPVVELCGTVNFDQTRTFASETALLVSCVKDGSHKLVNSIRIDPISDDQVGVGDVTCCCPESGCAVMTTCPGC